MYEQQTNKKFLFSIAIIMFITLTGCSFVDKMSGMDQTKELMQKGVPARGIILKIWDTGIKINDDPVVGFLIEVHRDQQPPYEATTKCLISILDIPRIQPGNEIPLRVDPADPSRVAIDIGPNEAGNRE